ncbi:phosphatase PAP2 family protein [Fluviispira multicolorata]|uniref:Phosphatase PAP2 family protein n=1 Tax=Fluviispira multicolorata TaxID=2654512 RepID=A0A833JEV9_9BACT|nr:phosphatase PAP2 family protein [Fluviispira multicolorata]KAB8033420.1 phosphatase PAP2 family protein [Fluviispira multicolorata]
MSPLVNKSKKIINKSTSHNTNVTFFFCLSLVILINVFLNYKEPFETWIEIVGTIFQIAIPMYALVPVLWKKDKVGALQMIKVLIFVVGITWAFKLGLSNVFGIDDTRPRGGSMSFPSGHTAGAFSGAVFLALRYGLKYAIIAVPLAAFVGFSRIYSFAHWPTDVIAAVILCCLGGLIFVKPLKKRK